MLPGLRLREAAGAALQGHLPQLPDDPAELRRLVVTMAVRAAPGERRDTTWGRHAKRPEIA
jgi:hypothetical protein